MHARTQKTLSLSFPMCFWHQEPLQRAQFASTARDGCHALGQGALPVPPCPATLPLQAPRAVFPPTAGGSQAALWPLSNPDNLSWCTKSHRMIRICCLGWGSASDRARARTADNAAGCFTRTCEREGRPGGEERASSHNKPSHCA